MQEAARVGVNSKGKKYLRGGIPGTGLYYQSSVPDALHVHSGGTLQSTTSVSPLVILIVVFVVGVMIYAMSSSTPTVTSAPVTPVPQVVSPVTAPVAIKHVVKKQKRKHTIHPDPNTTTKPDEAPAAGPASSKGTGNLPSLISKQHMGGPATP